MTYAQAQTARWEKLTTLVNSWDCRDEIDTYVSDYGTGRDIPGTPMRDFTDAVEVNRPTNCALWSSSLSRGDGLHDHV
jgi:hypothetical protein